MPFKSIYADLEIPKTNILSYLFPPNQEPSDEPIWIDASDTRKSLSPRQLLQWVKRLAVGLDKLGVAKQEAVLIYTPNHIFVPVAYLGIVGSGRVFSGMNPIYTINEIVHQIKNTGAKMILAHPSLLRNAIEAGSQAGISANRIFQFSDQWQQPMHGITDWTQIAGSVSDADHYTWDFMEQTSTTTVATINYSSGTTGLPKGVCVSHYNLIANAEQTIYMRDQECSYSPAERPKEKWIGFLPLYHAYGQLYVNIMAAKLGFPVYIMKQFVYDQFLHVVQTHRITHLQVAPPILVMLSKRPETLKYDLSSIKNILCGAAPLSKELQNDVSKRFKVNIVQGWGMTEVTCGAIHVPGGRYDESGSVGYLDPNCECKLLDDDGKEVAPGEPGEIFVRGPNICLEYWQNKQATAESIDEQKWLKTGDVAVVKDNLFWIVDRKKELIKVNALQVAPAELEAALLEHDNVADAAVVGISLHGEEWPRAYVTLKEESKGKVTESQIQHWIKSRVAKHKQLVGGVKFIEEVPKLASGKIQRKLMRDWAKRDAKQMEGTIKARL